MKMGEIIRKLRIERGMTQEELGKVLGVQKSAIRKYESGAVENIKRSSIKKMADLFGVSPSYLLGYEETVTVNNGIIGDHNNNNVISNGVEASGEMEGELLSLCKKMTIEEKTKLLTYAYRIVNKEV